MTIDKDYIKELLNKIESTDRSVFKITDIVQQEEMLSEKFILHIRILAEKGLIINDIKNSDEIGINRLGNGSISWGITWLRMSSEGYDFIEALNNETVWTKIKKELKAPSITTLIETAKFLLSETIKSQLN